MPSVPAQMVDVGRHAESARFRNSLKGVWNFNLGCVLFDGRDVKLVDCGNVPGFPMDIGRTVDYDGLDPFNW